jgi:DNA-binding NarL/FixJ family response regulator
LTRRQKQILGLAAEGCGNKTIGSKLGISSSTVATHFRRLFGKHHVHTRTALLAKTLHLVPAGITH